MCAYSVACHNNKQQYYKYEYEFDVTLYINMLFYFFLADV
jgi:hypothetical protein